MDGLSGDLPGAIGELSRPCLAVALDVPTLADALTLARRVGDAVDMFKLGLELFWREGPAAVDGIARLGKPVFADTKLDDIPRTVAKAAAGIARLPVAMFTVHTSGGREMLAAAVEGAAEGAGAAGRPRPLVVGVTVLTSLDRAGLAGTGIDADVESVVRRRVELAADVGLDGVVCAPVDLPLIGDVAAALIRVTPGIRPFPVHAGAPSDIVAEADDQRRVATPEAALDAGADVLVVGRPVTEADDPAGVAGGIAAKVIARREIAG